MDGGPPKSALKINGVSLYDTIQKDSEAILGKNSVDRWGRNFPYLFKVLSANEALSIQLHPNKEEAEALHTADPEHYPMTITNPK